MSGWWWCEMHRLYHGGDCPICFKAPSQPEAGQKTWTPIDELVTEYEQDPDIKKLIDESRADLSVPAASPREEPAEYHFVCDGPPSHNAGRFVELENAQGKSINPGRWEQRGDYWHLIVPAPDVFRIRVDANAYENMVSKDDYDALERRLQEAEARIRIKDILLDNQREIIGTLLPINAGEQDATTSEMVSQSRPVSVSGNPVTGLSQISVDNAGPSPVSPAPNAATAAPIINTEDSGAAKAESSEGAVAAAPAHSHEWPVTYRAECPACNDVVRAPSQPEAPHYHGWHKCYGKDCGPSPNAAPREETKVANTDWAWCRQEPRSAAQLIDSLERRLQETQREHKEELDILRRNSIKAIADEFHEKYRQKERADAALHSAEALRVERDALRYWLDNNTTFQDAGVAPTLASVTKRIWYHATNDVTSYPFTAVIDASKSAGGERE